MVTVVYLDCETGAEIILTVEAIGARLVQQTLLYHDDLHAVDDFEAECIRPVINKIEVSMLLPYVMNFPRTKSE